jgi:UMF1 family MFS transporter
MMPHWYGFVPEALKEGETAPIIVYKLSFVIVGIWWLVFAQYTLYHLPYNPHHRKPEKDYIFKGFRELRQVLRELKNQYSLKIFLISFFLFSAGVQTIIVLAGKFGAEELGLPTTNLIITILLVQLVAVVGAFIFSRISNKIGNIKTLKITLVIWVIVSFAAYLLPGEHPKVNIFFYTLGGFLGLVLGATQTLARSTYSKLIPEDTLDTATYFSFFDVTEKLAIVVGTVIFAYLVGITNSMRTSVLVLALFFFAGLIVLSFMKKTKYVE